jgi:UDP-N-acetylglucosamine 3-dehydrogenase
MGRNHARVLSEMPDVELVAVADSNPQAAAMVARRTGARAYTDYSQLLDKERLDAVTVAVPTVGHLPIALEVIRHGINTLIEKPIASSVDEGRRIIAAAEQTGVALMIGHIERFNPAVIALKAHLAVGELGRLFHIAAHREGPFPARVQDVGVVIDLAVHELDVMRYVTGAEVVRIYAETQQQIHSTNEDLLSGLIRLSDGTVGTLAINWLTPTKIRELYVTGVCGMFRVDYLTQDLYFFENAMANGETWDTLSILRGVSEGRMIRHVVAKKEPLQSEQEAFLAAIRGREAVPVTGADGLQALELAQALVTSGLEHRIVTFDSGRDASRK